MEEIILKNDCSDKGSIVCSGTSYSKLIVPEPGDISVIQIPKVKQDTEYSIFVTFEGSKDIIKVILKDKRIIRTETTSFKKLDISKSDILKAMEGYNDEKI